MVKIHVKRDNESQFLYETVTSTLIKDILRDVVAIYNGKLKIKRLCLELEELSKHGVMLHSSSTKLDDKQVEENELKEAQTGQYVPCGGCIENKDPTKRRTGQAPVQDMVDLIKKTISEASTTISNEQVAADTCLTPAMVTELLELIRSTVIVVYPMGLPPHDIIFKELENTEDLSGTQAGLEVIDESVAELWWANKLLNPENKLESYIGKNEKTKIIAKLQKQGHGAPAREPVLNQEQQKEMMLKEFRRREDLKRLEEDGDDSYLDADWANRSNLKCSFQGLQNISWKPK